MYQPHKRKEKIRAGHSLGLKDYLDPEKVFLQKNANNF